MMNKMIVANLVHRPIRSLISIVAIALEVTLILLIVGLSVGMLNDARQRQAGIGADVIVQPPNTSFMAGVSNAPMSIKIGGVLAQLPHVKTVAPVIWQLSTAKNLEVIYGIDLKSFEALVPFHYLHGGPFQGPNDCLVDDYFAQSQHVKVGSTIEILNHDFRVAGIVEHGRGARKFLPMTTLQDLIGSEGKASVFYVKLDDPANADAVVQEVKNVPGMENYSVRSMREYLSMMTTSSYPGLVDVHQCRDRHFGGDRVHRDFPGHVHGGDGTHPRDRNSEIDWRVEVLHRERDSAGDGAAGDRWDCGRSSVQPGGACRNQVPPAHASGGGYRRMDPAVDDHRHRRRDPGRIISGVQGGAERSD